MPTQKPTKPSERIEELTEGILNQLPYREIITTEIRVWAQTNAIIQYIDEAQEKEGV